MLYVRFPLSLRNVEDLLHERGIDVSHESVRFWWNRFGLMFAAEIRRKCAERLRSGPQWRWHLDEVFVKINGERHYLWRAVDHEGEVLESFVTKKRDKKAALKFHKKTMRRYGRPTTIVTDLLRSYGAALKEIGAVEFAGNGPVDEQSSGELAPAFPTTRKGDAAVPANAKFADVCRRPRLGLQPFQLGAQLLLTSQFQEEPRRRSRRVARSLHGIRDSYPALVETGSNPSDTTHRPSPLPLPSSSGSENRCGL